jgi:mRNA-degrading endonuclease toxin of MazEF toxin-antitoxin module
MLPIVLSKFPFLDKTGTKLRPCVVLTSQKFQNYEISILAYISSNIPTEVKESDLIIGDNDIAGAGLTKTSYIRLHKLLTVDNYDIQRQIGIIDNELESALKQKLVQLFNI